MLVKRRLVVLQQVRQSASFECNIGMVMDRVCAALYEAKRELGEPGAIPLAIETVKSLRPNCERLVYETKRRKEQAVTIAVGLGTLAQWCFCDVLPAPGWSWNVSDNRFSHEIWISVNKTTAELSLHRFVIETRITNNRCRMPGEVR